MKKAIVMKCILVCFEVWSGLLINYHKSPMIILGRKTVSMGFIQSLFGCKEVSLPITYLGIPIRKNRLLRNDWYELLDKIQKRLEGWKVRSLSLGGV